MLCLFVVVVFFVGVVFVVFFFNDTATTEIYTLSLHDALPILMRVFADSFLSDVSSQGSPGLDELRWYHPVRPGDTLFVRAVVLEARLSKSKPELGVMRTRTEVHNQNHELVLSSTAANFIRRRPAGKT